MSVIKELEKIGADASYPVDELDSDLKEAINNLRASSHSMNANLIISEPTDPDEPDRDPEPEDPR